MKEVLWTEIAETDLDSVLLYLRVNWSQQVLNKFKSKLITQLERIIKNPNQFPFLNRKRGYRKCVVTKHNTIIYKEFESHIVVLRLFDTRQHSNKQIFE